MLEIKSLDVEIEGKSILRGLNLELKSGEISALMGPNGSGKSTLAHVLAGHPSYQVTGGSLKFLGKKINNLSPEQRAQAGIFLAFQYPASIPGVSVSQFLRLALNAQEKARGEPLTPMTNFLRELRQRMKDLGIPLEFAQRGVNDGFSGGEKKRLEMLQMLLLKPRLVILDEIDSGLDIDAIKIVAEAVNQLDKAKTTVLIITHYQRLLNYIQPDSVHIMQGGTIVKEGGKELALQLEKRGYKLIKP